MDILSDDKNTTFDPLIVKLEEYKKELNDLETASEVKIQFTDLFCFS